MTVLYVYGTLRPSTLDTVIIKGQLFDLGWFPGLKMDLDGEVVCNRIEVDDIEKIDRYEGYREDDHEGSLYIRRPFLDGYIYEFNRDVSPAARVLSGEWLEYTQEKRGRNAGYS